MAKKNVKYVWAIALVVIVLAVIAFAAYKKNNPLFAPDSSLSADSELSVDEFPQPSSTGQDSCSGDGWVTGAKKLGQCASATVDCASYPPFPAVQPGDSNSLTNWARTQCKNQLQLQRCLPPSSLPPASQNPACNEIVDSPAQCGDAVCRTSARDVRTSTKCIAKEIEGPLQSYCTYIPGEATASGSCTITGIWPARTYSGTVTCSQDLVIQKNTNKYNCVVPDKFCDGVRGVAQQ